MDKMSLFSILTVSVPEAILNIYLAFVLTGQRNKLYPDSLNIIRLLIAVPLMVVASVTSRAMLENMAYVFLVNFLVYTIILKLVYRLKWKDSLLCVVIICGFLITVEAIYIYPFITLYSKNLDIYYSNDIVRLVSSIPERFAQLAVIISFWKWDLVYLDLRGLKKIQSAFILLVVLLLSTELAFSYVFVNSLDRLLFPFKVTIIMGSFLFAIINYLLCKVVIMLARRNY